MAVDNPGKWDFSCQVADHFTGGMFAVYNAQECKKSAPAPTFTGTVREYFIAAEETEWDYGPSGRNMFDGGFLKNGRRVYDAIHNNTKTQELKLETSLGLKCRNFIWLKNSLKISLGLKSLVKTSLGLETQVETSLA